ncbi:hypothetical protein BROOK1789C_685, partial [Bathymodiolus brooksi thiotrophic gill symbiont]
LIKNERSANTMPPLRDRDNNFNLSYDCFEKAGILNRHFCSVSDLNDRNKDLPPFEVRCKNVLSQIIVSEQDILDMISTLDANKAVGPDIISNKMLIAVKVQISKPLCMLFNKSLHQNIFPTDWKLAHVIPLFKAGDKSFPSNYRPVSLLSCVSKLLEKIVFKHIFNHLQGNKLLCKFQSGFLPGCSTTHQLVELYHRILLALDSKQFTSVTFADISKAFDTVWIKGLLLKLERYGIGDNLLIWLKSYLSNRTQRVVIKDALSNIGQLKAGVPQGSVLGPLLFLVFINDIADGMTGLGRLFADDTSIGHIANDKDSLQDMVNLDLAYLKDWSKRWLVKFNQNKTEIMVFSSRDTKLYFNFDFEGASLRDVELHKHLGVIFSNDCKWTKHIDKLIEKSSKQINVLRKLKFKLKRNYLEKIYLTFIRPILEYASEVWFNCGQFNSNRLEKVQTEAARIVCGFPSYASIASIYKETGWDKLKVRREVKNLTLFYKIYNNLAPEYLSDLIPPTVSETSNYYLRNSQNISQQVNRLALLQQSFFPSTIKLWNTLDLNIRQIPILAHFKSKIRQIYFQNVKKSAHFSCGNRYLSVLHTRIRNKCSSLKEDLYSTNLISNPNCICGYQNENADHYLLFCNRYIVYRNKMLSSLAILNMNGVEINVDTLLFGNDFLSDETNCEIFLIIQRYIKDTGRFSV